MHPYHGLGDLAAGAVQVVETPPAQSGPFVPAVAGPSTGGLTNSPFAAGDSGGELGVGMGSLQVRRPASTVVAALEAEFDWDLPRAGSDEETDDRCANGLADGEVVYGDMQPASLDGEPGLRASGAHACIVATRLSKKRKPATPFGFGEGMDRSHLVAYTFFGNNSGENIVPLYSWVNQRHMRDSVERATAAAVRSGQKVAYDVTPIYVGESPIPVAIQIHAEGTGGFKCNVIISNYKDKDGQRSSC